MSNYPAQNSQRFALDLDGTRIFRTHSVTGAWVELPLWARQIVMTTDFSEYMWPTSAQYRNAIDQFTVLFPEPRDLTGMYLDCHSFFVGYALGNHTNYYGSPAPQNGPIYPNALPNDPSTWPVYAKNGAPIRCEISSDSSDGVNGTWRQAAISGPHSVRCSRGLGSASYGLQGNSGTFDYDEGYWPSDNDFTTGSVDPDQWPGNGAAGAIAAGSVYGGVGSQVAPSRDQWTGGGGWFNNQITPGGVAFFDLQSGEGDPDSWGTFFHLRQAHGSIGNVNNLEQHASQSRQRIVPLAFNNVRAIRFWLEQAYCNADANGNMTSLWYAPAFWTPATGTAPGVRLRTLHLYGRHTPGDAQDKVEFWHATQSRQLTQADTDAGDVQMGVAQTFSFRLANISATKTAKDVKLLADRLYPFFADNTPTYANDLTVSADGTHFSTGVHVGDIAPGAQVTCYAQIKPKGSMGPASPRMTFQVGSWQ